MRKQKITANPRSRAALICFGNTRICIEFRKTEKINAGRLISEASHVRFQTKQGGREGVKRGGNGNAGAGGGQQRLGAGAAAASKTTQAYETTRKRAFRELACELQA